MFDSDVELKGAVTVSRGRTTPAQKPIGWLLRGKFFVVNKNLSLVFLWSNIGHVNLNGENALLNIVRI